MELFQDVHGAELGLVKAGLVLIGYEENLVVVFIEFSRQGVFGKAVHARFCVFPSFMRQLYRPGKSDEGFDVLVALDMDILLKGQAVFDGFFAGRRDDHSLGRTA